MRPGHVEMEQLDRWMLESEHARDTPRAAVSRCTRTWRHISSRHLSIVGERKYS